MHFLVGPVSDNIGFVFDFLESDNLWFGLIVVFQDFRKQKPTLFNLDRQLFEQIEKFFFPGNYSHLGSSSLETSA
ncbi:MAG: hypothetical protein A4E66_02163 [Syntrophus sp. PtaB.Bin001]|nr:MAG: hypothetical protein A4E66_02163 [Syntrophus sp. PtaB.Bin001]